MDVRTLTLRLALLALPLAAAQHTFAADAFDMYICDVAILQNKAIQSELKVSKAQRDAMNRHAIWLSARGASIDGLVKSQKMTIKQGNKQMATYLGQLKVKVLSELTDAQVRRLREITLQRDGLLPLMDKKVADKIGITDVQLKKIREAYLANDRAAKQIQQKAFDPVFAKYGKMKPRNETEKKQLEVQANKELDAEKARIQPQLAQLGKEFENLIKDTLTKGQQDAFKALKGKPFDPPKTPGGGSC